MSELTTISARLRAAKRPEDIFGEIVGSPDEMLTAARRTFRNLARETHPDRHPDHPDLATEAFEHLGELWRIAERSIRTGVYGSSGLPDGPITIRTKRREHTLVRKIGSGSIADLYESTFPGGEAVFKVARRPVNNDLLAAEARTLKLLNESVDERWRAFHPTLLESCSIKQKGGIVKRGNFLEPLHGFYSLREVREAHRNGIHALDSAWMYRRLLVALDLAHQQGVIHGAVLPENILIHPEKHGLVLIDWCYSVSGSDDHVRAIVTRYRDQDWYPPEILGRTTPGPESDIYMAAKVMFYLVDNMPRPFKAFMNACLLPQGRRLDDAFEVKLLFDEMLVDLNGPLKFRPFSMPRKER